MAAIFSSVPTFSFATSPKVVVIGGGIAGLTAAFRLQKAGMNVDLYEARGRIGGRIFTAKINGRIAELGGQNITDGGDAINLNRLIDEFGLQRVSSRVYLKHSYFNGVDLTPLSEILRTRKIDPVLLREELDKLALTSFNMKEVLEQIVNSQHPLYKILAVRMAAYEGGTVEKLSPIYTETLFHMLLGGICSVHQGNKEEEAYVDLVTIEGGNSMLPQKLGEMLGPKLHLNMPLKKVSKTENGSYQLIFQNGIEVQADILVLAMPCSVYQDITFEEGIIPDSKLKAIRKVQYGANAKIMVPFTTDPSTTTGLVGDEIVSFFDRVQQILTVYYTGETSLFSPQTIANSYIQARPMIECGFENCPPFTSPIYAIDEANLSYEWPIGYSWPNDSYAKGTYSYIASGQESVLTATVEENGETFKKLFAPVRQNLYFAGEHTSILCDVPGTMEAACESGERIARAILQNRKDKFSHKLISDPVVTAIPIIECNEPLIDLREQDIIMFGPPPERPDNVCYTKVRKSLYEKLCEAQKLLPEGVRFCLYEGWRSLELQNELFQEMYDNNERSYPKMTANELFIETTKLVSPVRLFDGTPNIPPHSTGAAIDVYLINDERQLLDMGLPIDQWAQDVGAALSQTDSIYISQKARENRFIMSKALLKVGFVNYPYEYWHWSYGDRYWAYCTKAPNAIYSSLSVYQGVIE